MRTAGPVGRAPPEPVAQGLPRPPPRPSQQHPRSTRRPVHRSPVPLALKHVPQTRWDRPSGDSRLHGAGATDRETQPGTRPEAQPLPAAPQRPQADLCRLHRLPEGQAGAVVPLGVDVGEDSNEEGWWVPLRTQLPPAGLAKLWRGRGQGWAASSLCPPAAWSSACPPPHKRELRAACLTVEGGPCNAGHGPTTGGGG